MDDGRQVMAKAHVAEDVGKSSDMSVKTGSLKRKLDEGIFNLEFSLKITKRRQLPGAPPPPPPDPLPPQTPAGGISPQTPLCLTLFRPSLRPCQDTFYFHSLVIFLVYKCLSYCCEFDFSL
jgi:hypothetical protein